MTPAQELTSEQASDALTVYLRKRIAEIKADRPRSWASEPSKLAAIRELERELPGEVF